MEIAGIPAPAHDGVSLVPLLKGGSSPPRTELFWHYPHYWGGIRNQQHLSKFCEVLEMGLSMHSNNHLGVSLMTMAHAAAAAPRLTFACDTHYPWQSDELLVGGALGVGPSASVEDDGSATYVGTYTAYDGDRVSTQILALDGRGGFERFADYDQWESRRALPAAPLIFANSAWRLSRKSGASALRMFVSRV